MVRNRTSLPVSELPWLFFLLCMHAYIKSYDAPTCKWLICQLRQEQPGGFLSVHHMYNCNSHGDIFWLHPRKIQWNCGRKMHRCPAFSMVSWTSDFCLRKSACNERRWAAQQVEASMSHEVFRHLRCRPPLDHKPLSSKTICISFGCRFSSNLGISVQHNHGLWNLLITMHKPAISLAGLLPTKAEVHSLNKKGICWVFQMSLRIIKPWKGPDIQDQELFQMLEWFFLSTGDNFSFTADKKEILLPAWQKAH